MSENSSPKQRAYIMDVEVEYDLDQIRVLLEWQEKIPVCFQEEELRLAEGVTARVIPLKAGERLWRGSHNQGRRIGV